MQAESLVTVLEEWIEVSRHRSMHDFLQYARKAGLTMSNVGALNHINRQGACAVTALGAHLDVSGAAASQMMERLVQQGLVLRSVDPEDRRVKRVQLTEKGHQVLDEGVRARQGWLDDLAAALSDEEKRQVIAALHVLIEKTGQLGEPDREAGCRHPGE